MKKVQKKRPGKTQAPQPAKQQKVRQKPKREKKPSPYSRVAVVWWQWEEGERWFLDASLTDKVHLTGELAELLERRVNALLGEPLPRVLRKGVMRADDLRASIAINPSELLPVFEEVTLSPGVEMFIQDTARLGAWIHEAQRHREAPLHFATWVKMGMPVRPKRVRKPKKEGGEK